MQQSCFRRAGWFVLLGLVATVACAWSPRHARADAASSLTADNLLLVVNKNEPAGQRLAAQYAKARNIPDRRIVLLDLPPGEEISPEQFQADVIRPIQIFLKTEFLDEKVTCLVTFYGMPLRVQQRVNTPQESAEYRTVDQEFKEALAATTQSVKVAEQIATEVRAEYKPPTTSDELPALPVRADAAVRAAVDALAGETDADRRNLRFSRLMAVIEKLYGPLETQERLATPAYQRLAAKPLTPEEQATRQATTRRVLSEVQALLQKSMDSIEARNELRSLFTTHLGSIRTLQLVLEQRSRLETNETQAAVDSELACLWWPQRMVRYRWHESPLHYRLRFASRPPNAPPLARTLMVSRLDGPSEAIVSGIIETSVKVEGQGLKGIAAFDARGKQPPDAYGRFDEKLREAAAEVRTKSRTEVRLDDSDPVFTSRSVDNVAVYCGWYSLRNYVPGMIFNEGAIGYHVASGEMISLHHPGEKGWCANLLKAGVVATLGPVAEPYLHSFPLPNEFFTLLLTGKLTLAEVYWYTNPLVSWMNTLIGDPLYNPYKKNPSMKDIDVSPQLRVIFAARAATPPSAPAASAPTSNPTPSR